ncbi:GNAT family N-acetyltransferase [Brachybacterium kimchii]|uniref:GNAT family N-acetyltransferase n=1 Tax=Brachybacterium kimchii TaxID=2942909 RepID=A0ABY4N269_9MICO|nr:GNAT family N-acetyltransferase [Brachybacterium kimchii]UQN28224.1 GNAT family N-acetyltransferase [Brachybacterium kimchii]
MSAPRLSTSRLSLRRFQPSDRQFVLELHQGPDLRRFIESAVLDTLEDADEWISRSIGQRNPWHGFWCATLHDTTPVAALLLEPVIYSAGQTGDEVEIGWRTHPHHTGHGYATEAGQALLTAVLGEGHERIIAVVAPENLASQAVCRRLGMTYLGRSDRYYDVDLDTFERAH